MYSLEGRRKFISLLICYKQNFELVAIFIHPYEHIFNLFHLLIWSYREGVF